MGHIRLAARPIWSWSAPPAPTFWRKMANGLADDLASTALLATDKPVMVCPTMNVMMWQHPATQANMLTLEARGVLRVGPGAGNLACGEVGTGRLAEVMDIVAAVEGSLPRQAHATAASPAGTPSSPAAPPGRPSTRSATSPTAPAASRATRSPRRSRNWARTTLVSGPTELARPAGVDVVRIESARQMYDACHAALPADIAVCAAAVADWRV